MAEVAEGLGAMRAVTTFSAQGYEVYGRTMIESFLEHWPEEVELWAFYERNKPRDASDRVIWKSLQDDKEWQKFAREHHHKDDPADYKYRPVRYCHKVFSYTSVPNDSYVIWMDADIVTTQRVTHEMLDKVLPQEEVASYLARPYYRHSETGFIAFAPHQEEFLAEVRRVYTSGELFYLPEWHDCAAFDHARRKFEKQGKEFYNLCPTARGLQVFEQSPLNAFLYHNKGPVRKSEAYGVAL
jgi:hypothetical protein